MFGVGKEQTQVEAASWRAETWQRRAWRILSDGKHALCVDKAARDYLGGRGLHPATWEAFRLGVGLAVDELGYKYLAVILPWLAGDGRTVQALNYRFVDTEHGQRYTTRPGSERLLFGLQNIGTHWDTLVLCEGEFNALSIWQALNDVGVRVYVDVVGMEDIDEAAELASRYSRVQVWSRMDDPFARKLATLAGGRLVELPAAQDANDLLAASIRGVRTYKDRLRIINGMALPDDQDMVRPATLADVVKREVMR